MDFHHEYRFKERLISKHVNIRDSETKMARMPQRGVECKKKKKETIIRKDNEARMKRKMAVEDKRGRKVSSPSKE